MATNVRVELSEKKYRDNPNNAFKIMHTTFKQQVNQFGVLSLVKEKQYFESKSEKKRRKKRDFECEQRKLLREKTK